LGLKVPAVAQSFHQPENVPEHKLQVRALLAFYSGQNFKVNCQIFSGNPNPIQ
jgi:hypothetical protein